jgi:ribosome-associated translation inhibitor RaiA
MKIQLNTDSNIKGSESLTAKVNAIIEKGMKHYADHVTRVEVHLGDENGDKSGPKDKRCMLEARLEGQPPVAVKDHATTLEQAVQGAVQQLTRLLESKMGRLSEHREKPSAQPLPDLEPPQM